MQNEKRTVTSGAMKKDLLRKLAKSLIWFYAVLLAVFSFGLTVTASAQTPPQTGLKVWLKADSITGVSSGEPVPSWPDSSSTGVSVTQSNTAKQPKWFDNVLNGKPVLRFDGADDNFITNYSGPGGNGFTFFIVAKGTNYQSIIRFQDGDYVVYPWTYGGGQQLIASNDGGTGGASSGLLLNEWNIGTAQWKSNTSGGMSTYRNGALVARRNTNGSNLPLRPLNIGSYVSGGEFTNADVAEILIYDMALSESSRVNVENYLMNKYAIGTGTLTGNGPAGVNGATVWLKADTGITKDANDNVSLWADQSGSGHHALQSTTTAQPKHMPSVLNNQPVVRFDGSDDFLNVASGLADFTHGITAFVVAKASTSANWSRLFDLGNGAAHNNILLAREGTSNNLAFQLFNGGTANGITSVDGYPTGTSYLFTAVAGSGAPGSLMTGQLFRDGLQLSMGNMSVPDNILRNSNFIGKSNWVDALFHGDIAEIVIYSRTLTDAERRSVEDALLSKYGMVLPPPEAPDVPVFSNSTSTSVTVTAPELPVRAASLSLQKKLQNETESAYMTIATGLNGGTTTNVQNLTASTIYDFRYVAVGLGGQTAGKSAQWFGDVPMSRLKVWLRADAVTGLADGSPVPTWPDSSGNGVVVSQNNSVRRPLWIENAVGNKPVVRFDGMDDLLSTDLFGPEGAGVTIFVVAKGAQYQSLVRFQSENWNWAIYPWAAGSGQDFILSNDGGTNAGLPAGLVANEWNVGTARWKANTTGGMSTYRNSSLVAQRSTNDTVLPWGQLGIGGFVRDSSELANADVAEILVYDTALSNTERLAVENYLLGKYNLLSPPDAPGVPTFSSSTATSVDVIAPSLPARATTLALQKKLYYEPDTSYATIASGLSGGVVTAVQNLLAADIYSFRYVALGPGGQTAGASAKWPETLPLQTNLKVWFRADSITGQQSWSPVSLWNDLSGNGFNAVQSNVAKQPVWIENSLNGRPVLRFDGSNDNFTSSYVGPGGSEVTLFVVAKGSNYISLIRHQDGGGYVVYPWGGVAGKDFIASNDGGVDAGLNAGFLLNQWNLGSARWKANTANGMAVYRNGVLVSQRSTNNSSLPNAPLNIGSYLSQGEFAKADIAEILVYNVALSDTERASVEEYLMGKYALLAPPDAPDAPTFSNIAPTSVTVTTPALPARAMSLTLQKKLKDDPESTYVTVATGLAGETPTHVQNLLPATAYSFRCIAVGLGGTASGAEGHITTMATPETQGQGTGLLGQYYKTANFAYDSYAFHRVDSRVSFHWGSGSPGPQIPSDQFSVRWTGKVQPRYSETYTFYANTDNGVRLWVNGQQIINRWNTATGESSGSITLVAGHKYNIKMEYYEDTSSASAVLLWSSNSQTKEVIPSTQLYPATIPPTRGTGTGLRGYYYTNQDSYTANWHHDPLHTPGFCSPYWQKALPPTTFFDFVATRVDPTVDFSSEYFVPIHPEIPWQQSFSVRWSGKIQPLFSDDYTFYTEYNDGVRLWVNGQELINDWRDQGASNGFLEDSMPIALQAGQKYDITVEYYENGWQGTYAHRHIRLLWSSLSQEKEVVPSWQLYPSPAPTAGVGTGTGLVGRYYHGTNHENYEMDRVDDSIDFDWQAQQPIGSIASPFSARWTGAVEPRFSERYVFYVNAGGGARLWVNDQLIVDAWEKTGEHFGAIDLTAGLRYRVLLEFYETGGPSSLRLLWSSPSQSKQVIPSSQLHQHSKTVAFPLFGSCSTLDPAVHPCPKVPRMDQARFIYQDVPSLMVAGQTYRISIRLKNVGASTWINDGTIDRHLLTETNYRWTGIREMPQPVPPYETVTFDFDVTAPSIPGIYPFQWSLGVWEPTPNMLVKVIAAPQQAPELKLPKPVVTEVKSNKICFQVPQLPQGAYNLRLQRISNQVPATPLPQDGLAAWFRADAAMDANPQSNVQLWPDMVAGKDAVQDVPKSRPLLIRDALNGRPVIRINSADANYHHFLKINQGMLNGDEVTIAAVAKGTEYHSLLRLHSTPNSSSPDNALYYPFSPYDEQGRLVHWVDGSDQISPWAGWIHNQWNLGIATRKANVTNGLATYRNGVLVDQKNTTDASVPDGVGYIGNPSDHWGTRTAADVAEIIVYNKSLSESERVALENYLNFKYGIYVPTVNEGDWTTVATNVSGDTYCDTSVSSNTHYLYRWAADGPEGEYLVSPAASVSTLPSAPTVPPGAPVITNVLARQVTVTAPELPEGAFALLLQRKLQVEPESAYVSIGLMRGEDTRVFDKLVPETGYDFRFVAIGEGGSIPGPAASVTTAIPEPDEPDAPSLSNIGQTSLDATMPALPPRATSLSLQYKVSGEPDTEYQTAATGLDAGATATVTGLATGQSYLFRSVAVGPGGSTPGKKLAAATLGMQAPDEPDAPTFSNLWVTSVTVHAPGLPDRATSLTLQGKLAAKPDSAYVNLLSDLPANATTGMTALSSGETYSFRYVAVGAGGRMPGESAEVTLLTPTYSWLPGESISCQGIRYPKAGVTVAPGAPLKLSSYIATDFDIREMTAGGQTRSSRYSDPCSYTWNFDGGSMQGGVNTGQNVVWLAPNTPGTYTIGLVVDDQNTANKPPHEGGSRNDATKGYNDQPLKFSLSVTVQ